MIVSKEIEKAQIDFIKSGIDKIEKVKNEPDPFWKSLSDTGTELWLDTGDIEQAESIWSSEMKALTTNNTLLNAEIQKGIYDDFIRKAGELLSDLSIDDKVVEIAFMLNAKHGLKLVKKFGGKVSVELHTNTAHDLDAILAYGKRFHEINPDDFIIKVPYTPTGLIGAAKLKESGVPINFTLEFSARQNALVAAIVKPDYLNVFLGRLNGYVLSNELGDGKYVGEKATIESQRIVHELTRDNLTTTKQIAASLRSGKQLKYLAGIDVFTMPVKVALEAVETMPGEFSDKTGMDYEAGVRNEVAGDANIHKVWEISEHVKDLALHFMRKPPANAEEIIQTAHEYKCGDMFPDWSDEELLQLKADGKIPDHAKWTEKIKKGLVAPDTLLNMAGLLTFTKDQEALDNRIRSILADN